ncbi:MAG: adenosine deaminase [Terracidiphilus sp.]|jgi:adenosine deaminase
MFRRVLFSACFALAFAAGVAGQPPAPSGQGAAASSQGSAANAERAYQAAVKAGAPALRAFLKDFPKGANLHVHLSGAVYAETFIRDAGEDGLCVDPVALSLAKPPCTGNLTPAINLSGDMSRQSQLLYDKLINSISMRSFVPSAGWSGHDQFFAVFDRIDGLNKSHMAEWVDEVASRAAAQNNQYLELMMTPPFSHAAQIAHEIGWNAQLAQADPQAFAQFRQQLLDKGLRGEVQTDRDDAQRTADGREQMEHCGTPQAAPACQVEVRYLFQALRAAAPEQVFAQLLLGFETVQASMAAKDGTWVGINLVQPEDGLISMRDYTLQMKMIGYLHSVYPNVPISLHAGELAYGLVPPEGLTFHIRQAVELAGAGRIGHGVDLMEEDDPQGLLKELREKHVMVEINLSSNEAILGVKGAHHPFPTYFAADAPVALSTDDEGVSRIDLTNEYVRAALDYRLSYRDLKKLARTGLEHSFLPGEDLWAWPDDLEAAKKPCQGETLGGDTPSAACKAFLNSSEKATAQWELERRFRVFQARF